jgi:hypothetical protein
MAHPMHTLSTEGIHYTLLTRVFGGIESPQLKRKWETSLKGLKAPVEKLHMNDSEVTRALERACIPDAAASFVTFRPLYSHMRIWERSAAIEVIELDQPGAAATVKANLQSLVRDFGACIAIPQLYGEGLLLQYPQLLEDLWKFDNDLFPLLMIGVPSWLPCGIKDGLAARSRLIDQMSALYRRIDQYQRGEPFDPAVDMSDISEAALERNRIFNRDGWTFQERGVADLTNLWAQNANTQPLLFWFLTYVYSTDGVVERLREEIAPYVQLSKTTPCEIIGFDIAGLSKNCQLLKSCIFETYRLVNEPTSIRYVTRPVAIEDGGAKHDLKPGTFLSAPHSLINHDPSIFPNAEKFIPERFLEPDPEAGKPVARYGRLKPWGSGTAICKGRTFAEKEIISVGAAIISLWDIKPASERWELPKILPGTGVKKPVSDIRVLITRRRL